MAKNTTVASTPSARAAMAAFVTPGHTTETDLTTRWGNPVQKVRRGAQTDFIYRDMRNPAGSFALAQFGSSTSYVIVTFQYGMAIGVRTSDEILCRGTFAPRPPNYTFDNPTRVELIGACRDAVSGGSISDDSYTPKGKAGPANQRR
ncbi:MAG: hypothetical protein AAGK37_09250 [Pseudomonadota bacterium]